jgi:lysine 2,3-aminomutase
MTPSEPALREQIPLPASPGAKSKARPPAERQVRAPASTRALAHRDLRSGEFWRESPLYEDVTSEEFLDHKWQMKNSMYGEESLVETLSRGAPQEFVDDVRDGFRRAPMAVRVTPYLLSLIDWQDPWRDPIRTQFIPVGSQLMPNHPMLTLDSLHEQEDAPVEGLTHRYPDKALFLPLDTCPVYCRFCTRSYAIGVDTDTVEKVSLKINPQRWEQAFDYIESRAELEDIVISGGDAFNLPAKHLKTIGERLLSMPNIRRIRFATKGIAVMPMKVLSDDPWFQALAEVAAMGRQRFKEVCVHTHFNHPNEITEVSRQAMLRLFEQAITVRNQSVLQRGVNDDAQTMQLLTKRLSEINVQPYYVYQHDMVQGVEDLRTSVGTTIDLEKNVRGVTAGFNTPTFVVDAPGGGGKRDVHSCEHYDSETGISVYTAPSVKPGEHFLYFDPLHSLSELVRKAWQDEDQRREMCDAALAAV